MIERVPLVAIVSRLSTGRPGFPREESRKRIVWGEHTTPMALHGPEKPAFVALKKAYRAKRRELAESGLSASGQKL